MAKFFEIETDNGKEVRFVPDGSAQNAEGGMIVRLVNDLPALVAILNDEYTTSLLHYQDESKVDIQKLLNRSIQKYLKNKEIM